MSKLFDSSAAIQRAAAATVEQLEGRIFFYGVTVGVNANDAQQTMDGFGAAMATWKNVTGYNDAAFYDRIVNDLGATIARTAIWPTFETGNDNSDANQFDWSGFDKNAIGYAMTFMKRLQDRGMQNLLATVWTPPTYMKTNQTYYYGGTVRPDLREEFAEYLAAVAISADRDFGVNLSHLSVQNEPFFVQEYESASYTPEQMREVVRATMRKFAHEKIDAKFVVPEEMAKDERYKWYIDALMADPETRNFPGAFGVHGATNPFWEEIGDITRPHAQNLWSTESHGHAQTIEGALAMAQDIWNAVVEADASAYLYWQWSESADDGEHSLMVNGQPAIKYHVAKHFYRYIRPGMVRVDASSTTERLRSMSFKDPKTGAMTHVLFNNEDAEANVTLNLSGSGLPTSYKAYRTSGTEDHVQLANVAGGSQVKFTLPANSIVTLYSGPDLAPVAATSGGPLPGRHGLDDPSDNRLNKAAVEANIGDLREWLSRGDNVNATSFGGYSALHAAAASPYAGAVEVINELLSRGATITQATTEGFTPLHFASMNVWTRGSTTETSLAGDKVRALSAGGADENAKDNQGRTPLHWAAMMPKLADIEDLTLDPVVIDALLDGGASVNAKDDHGFTPLDYAVREGNTAAASELKRRGGVHGDGAPEEPPPPPPPPGGSDTTRPTVTFTPVSPDPRDTAVATVSLTFSESVNGVDVGDFRLMRDGRNVMPAGATLERVNGSTYRVNGLSAGTGNAGSYMLKLDSTIAGITDEAGNALLSSESENWTMSGGVGAPPRQTVLGTTGNDTIVVRQNGASVVVDINGTIHAIDAGPGELLIDAQEGNDRITVEVDAPRKLLITGSTGHDIIAGGPGDEELSGGVGFDRIYAGDGDDFLIGGGHNDYLNGEGGDDLVLGGGGNDRLHGGTGSNWLIGMLGNDILFGSPGVADSLSGNDGDDTVADADDGTDGTQNLDNIAGVENFIRTT